MKTVFSLFVFVFLFNAFTTATHASVILIDENGNMSMNVLGEQSDKKVSVTRVAVTDTSQKDKVFFSRSTDGVKLRIVTGSGEETLEVTDFGKELVEIEERQSVEKLSIGVIGDNYTITQGDIQVNTSHDISIDPETSRLSLSTPQGIRYISIFPKEAVSLLTKSKTFSQIDQETPIQIIEDVNGFLNYEIRGIKNVNVLNLIDLPIDIVGHVSTSSGEIVGIEQPAWLPIVDYLFR